MSNDQDRKLTRREIEESTEKEIKAFIDCGDARESIICNMTDKQYALFELLRYKFKFPLMAAIKTCGRM